MKNFLWAGGVTLIWLALQLWVLPKLGVET